ncbi:MAG: PSD1 and planctomycete cytochrome C domain-containing protein [Pirellula sp.]
MFLVLVFCIGSAQVADAQATVDFQKEVRPILANHCFACHGFDERSRQADLRLDLASSALDPDRAHRTIIAGDPQASHLVERIHSEDPDAVMPPASTNKPLTATQKEILERWIAQGARYENHWAFAPLSNASTPDARLKNDTYQNTIDLWIRSELDRRELTPSAPADPATLMRRLYLDLLGSLPSPEQLDAFENDLSPDRTDRLIESLLASPQFGERWGRIWLDQARYADSNGFTIDGPRTMWPYRDWVITAINADMPFDQFTIEQLAGDLLNNESNFSSIEKTNPPKNQLIATAFHRNTLINEEGGVKADQYRHEAIVDRVNTTGAVWLGLTIGCAQCHTHKYDPISIDDYYKMYAFFNACADNNAANPTIDVLEGEVFGLPASVAEDLAKLQQLNKQLKHLEAQIKKLNEAQVPELLWEPVSVAHATGSEGTNTITLTKLDDGSVLVPNSLRGNATLKIEFVLSAEKAQPITAVRLRTLTDPSLPHQGPGKAGNGNFVLSEFQLALDQKRQPFVRAWADHSQPKYPISDAIDSDPKTGWAINTDEAQVKAKPEVKMNAAHWAVFALSNPVSVGAQPFEVILMHEINKDYIIGRFAIDISTTPVAMVEPVPTEQVEQLKSEIAKLSSRLPNQGKTVPQMIYKDQAQAPATYRLLRGDFLSPDKDNGPLSPSIPSVFRDGQEIPMKDRLDLARWLVSAENPLTARVMVNRVWMKLFGMGLVETENDFGLQGSAPSHPELLDALAREWIDSGWSLKYLIYRIVSSATYQQSSAWRADIAEIDPSNRLLARQSRIRLDAEIVRDRALSASGAMTLRIGGPSVHPPQPAGVYNFTQNVKNWKEDTGENRYRKAMYTEFYRSAPYPLWTTFDSPDFSTVCTRRSRTNTPLQALTLANDPVFWELAILLADRADRELDQRPTQSDLTSNQPAIQDRIRRMVLLAWCRVPSPAEFERLSSFHSSSFEYYRQNPTELEKLGGLHAEQAALAQVARVLLNTDEFVNRD